MCRLLLLSGIMRILLTALPINIGLTTVASIQILLLAINMGMLGSQRKVLVTCKMMLVA